MNKLTELEKLARDATEWPKIGRKYIVKFGEHWQHDTYMFEGSDNGLCIEHFWVGDDDDCDECPLFYPDTQQWIPLNYMAAANPAAILALLELAREQNEALDTLVAIVGLTAFKYENQRQVLQEAVDIAGAAINKYNALCGDGEGNES